MINDSKQALQNYTSHLSVEIDIYKMTIFCELEMSLTLMGEYL